MVTKAKAKQPDTPAPVVKQDLLPLYGDGSWREANKHIFPSDWSLRWFIRQHMDEVIKSGAMLEIAGRQFCNVQRFESLVQEIGTARFQGRVAAPKTRKQTAYAE